MNENKYYLKVDNRTVAECIPLEYALIFIKSIFENYYNDGDVEVVCGKCQHGKLFCYKCSKYEPKEEEG